MPTQSRNVYSKSFTGNDTGHPVKWNGYSVVAQITGTFDGATVTLQGSLDGVNWVNFENGAFNAAALQLVASAGGEWINIVVSGAGGSTDLLVQLQGIAQP